jgi:ketosteroid isomerase-like protein
MPRANVEIVRKSFEAFRVGGIEGLLPFLPPDVVWYSVPEWVEDPLYRGHDGARKLIAAFTENFDDWAWEVPEVRDAGERVAVLAEMTGRIKDSCATVRQRIGIVNSDFRDGKAGETRFFLSWQEALEAAGLTE